MYRLFLASHYLLKHRIMWVSVLGVAVGLASVILVDSIFNGFVNEHLRILKGVQADVVVKTASSPKNANPAMVELLASRLREVEGVAAVSKRVFRPCLFPTDEKLPQVLAFGQMSRGPVIQVFGIDPEREMTVSEFREYLDRVEDDPGVDGGSPRRCRVFDLEDPFDVSDLGQRDAFGQERLLPVLLGDRLAEHLGLQRGDEIQLVTFPDLEDVENAAETVSGRFLIAGSFATGKFDLDLGAAFMRFDDLCRFANMPLHPHELALRVEPGVSAEELADRVREFLPREWRRDSVVSWQQRSAYVEGAIQNQRSILNVILFVLVFVASFTLLITLCMTVTEKRRDLGVLASMGGSRFGVSTIFSSCGLLVGVVGSGLGLALGLLLTRHVNAVHDFMSKVLGTPIFTEEVYGFSRVPADVDPPWVALFVFGACLMTFSFSLVPTWIAGSLHPVDALRRN